MFVDADDWIDKEMIEIMYKETLENDLDITVCNSFKVLGRPMLIKQTNSSVYFKEEKVYKRDEIKNYLALAYLHGHPFPPTMWGKLYKKELLLKCGNYLKSIHFFRR